MNESTAELGHVQIADDVIASIAAVAATEVDGVHGLRGRRNSARGVRIIVENGIVTCHLFILIKRDFPILNVSRAVQKNVKAHIESMTGLRVGAVNAHVVGVAFGRGKV